MQTTVYRYFYLLTIFFIGGEDNAYYSAFTLETHFSLFNFYYKGLLINYVIFFRTIPFLCRLLTYPHLPPTPLPDDIIYEREKDISMIDYFVRCTLTAHSYFSSGSNFDASKGNGLTFTATFPWLECLIVL